MNRNRLGDELSEANIWNEAFSFRDEGYSYQKDFSGIRELTAFGSPNTVDNIIML